MNVSSTRNWTAEELRDLQLRGHFFYETFPGAKASEAWRQQGERSRTTENAARSQAHKTAASGSLRRDSQD